MNVKRKAQQRNMWAQTRSQKEPAREPGSREKKLKSRAIGIIIKKIPKKKKKKKKKKKNKKKKEKKRRKNAGGCK